MLLFRQLFDQQSSTYTYLLADGEGGEAVLIDPVFEQAQRDAALVRELRLRLAWTLETHVHADHVTGASILKHRLGSRIALSARAGAEGADRLLAQGDRIAFGARHLEVRETPGHTAGCITFLLDDRSMAFTGDCLLIRGCGRTDFQGGSAGALYRSVQNQIFTLPGSCLLYPGHDYRGASVTSVAEETRFNPRLGGERSESDFTGYMQNLNLAHPKKMDIAVPANLRCGNLMESAAIPAEPDWAPVTLSFAGIWEIEPYWLEEHASEVQIVDVREPDEFEGELGHLAGAALIPLGALGKRQDELQRDRPVVTVCRSGGRSAQAAVMLQQAGFPRVANLAGGMLRWHAERNTVDGGGI